MLAEEEDEVVSPPYESVIFADDVIHQWAQAVITQDRLEPTKTPLDLLINKHLATELGGKFYLTCSGVLLFANDPRKYLPGAYVRFLRYDGRTEQFGSQQNLVKDETFTGPLPTLLMRLRDFMRTQVREFSYLGPDGRFLNEPEYPEFVWDEAIVNAIVHRSYSFRNMPIFIKMFDDRLEVSSPGDYPFGVSPDNFIHNPRNPNLMEAMRYLQHVKMAQEGTRRMFQLMKDAALPEPEYSPPGRQVVMVVLRNNIDLRRGGEVEQHYFNFIRNEHERIRLFGFDSEENLFVFLQDVFVSLRLSEHRRKADAFNAREAVVDQLLTPQKILPAATARHRLLLVTGDPGSGKTTLLKYFALSCLDEEKRRHIGLTQPLLPIFLPLRKVDPTLRFAETLSRWASNRSRPVSTRQFEEWLDHPGALLLLDGLDEISDRQLRLKVCEWISEAHSAYGASTFVVTCRFTGFGREESQALRADHFHADVQDLNIDEQRTFLEKWFFAAYSNDRRALHSEMPEELADLRQQALDAANAVLEFIHREENLSLRFMAGSPVLLQIIAIIWKERGNLSTERAALYHRCTQFLLDHRDRAKGIDPLMSAEKALLLLRPLALWMQEELRKDEAPADELARRLAQPLQEIDPSLTPQKFLENLRDRAGLLQAFGDEAYIFRHKSFREYLASAELARQSQSQPQRVQVFVDNFEDNWWREPIVFAAGFAEPFVFPELMEAFLKSDKNAGPTSPLLLQLVREAVAKPLAPFEKIIRNQKLAWQKRYNALQCVRLLRSDAAKELVKIARQDKEPKVRKLAEQILIEWAVVKPPVVTPEKTNRFFNPIEDNAEYILIPGSEAFAGGSYKFSVIGKIVEVPDLFFAKYPVTNKLYNIFLESLPKSEREKHRSSYADDKRFNGDDQPVVGVSWYSAKAYCDWLNKAQVASGKEQKVFRLPTEEEWEWAASGGKREYPWGNEAPNDTRANYDKKVGQTTPVGSYPAGATPEGLIDMAGNVWEWMQNDFADDKNVAALRGGSYYEDAKWLRRAARFWINRGNRWRCNIGVRVVCAPLMELLKT